MWPLLLLFAWGKANQKKKAPAPRTGGKRWRLPLPTLPDGRKPVVSQRFGPRAKGKGTHWGVDVTYEARDGEGGLPRAYKGPYTPDRASHFFSPDNMPVTPVLPGTVTLTAAVDSSRIRGQVYVLHEDGTMTRYAHLSRVDVQPGDVVDTSTVLGIMGAGAGTPFRHLHLEWFNKRVKLGGKQQDPAGKLAIATENNPNVPGEA